MTSGKVLFGSTVEDQAAAVSSLPRPRPLKVNWAGKTITLALFLVLTVCYWALVGYQFLNYRDSRGTEIKFYIISSLTLLFLLVVLALLRDTLSDRALLRQGECVVGRIEAVKIIDQGEGQATEIFYSFAVGPGKEMKGHGMDRTSLSLEGMKVLVFYSKDKLEKNVAYCCTYWQVELKNGSLLEP